MLHSPPISSPPKSDFFGHKTDSHEINWCVYRSPNIAKFVNSLLKGQAPQRTEDLGGNTDKQCFVRVNALFRALEKYGPRLTGYKEPGDLNYNFAIQPDDRNDMCHCHLTNAHGLTYVVMWEAEDDVASAKRQGRKPVINIVNIGLHENFNYARKEPKTVTIGRTLGRIDFAEADQGHRYIKR